MEITLKLNQDQIDLLKGAIVVARDLFRRLKDGSNENITTSLCSVLDDVRRQLDGDSTPRAWIAVQASGLNIITVLAPTMVEAQIQVDHELSKNPSRQAYLEVWRRDGKKVILK